MRFYVCTVPILRHSRYNHTGWSIRVRVCTAKVDGQIVMTIGQSVHRSPPLPYHHRQFLFIPTVCLLLRCIYKDLRCARRNFGLGRDSTNQVKSSRFESHSISAYSPFCFSRENADFIIPWCLFAAYLVICHIPTQKEPKIRMFFWKHAALRPRKHTITNPRYPHPSF